MRRRNRSKSDVFIDLTSLLDVIFILLLIVLCGQSVVSEELVKAQEEAEKARIEAEKTSMLYEDQMELADHINQHVWAVSIMVPYEEEEITRRQIRFLKEGEEIETIDLVGNNVADSIKKFKASLTDYIEKNQEYPVILSLNDNDDYILYRDEVMVNEVFQELADTFGNVYIRGNAGEEK